MKQSNRKRSRTNHPLSGSGIRPQYSVYPDDDLYGSPRSWTEAIMSSPQDQSEKDQSDVGHLHRDSSLPRTSNMRSTAPRRRTLGDNRPDRFRPDESGGLSLWAAQLVGAVFLIGVTFLFFHSDKPFALSLKTDILHAFALDDTTALLPPEVARAFGANTTSSVQTVLALPPLDIVKPVQGALLQAFSKLSPDIVIGGRPGSQVVAAADGLVDSAGESQANGLFVTIDHGTFGQTFYAHLGRLRVHAHEYVTAGQLIGYLPAQSGKLTFGYIRGGSYQNPMLLLKSAKS